LFSKLIVRYKHELKVIRGWHFGLFRLRSTTTAQRNRVRSWGRFGGRGRYGVIRLKVKVQGSKVKVQGSNATRSRVQSRALSGAEVQMFKVQWFKGYYFLLTIFCWFKGSIPGTERSRSANV